MSRIMTYLKKNQRYVKLDMVEAKTISDYEWGRDVKTEEIECWRKMHEPLPTRHIRRRELNDEYRKLKEEGVESHIPRFPFIQKCLFLGAVTHSWRFWRLNSVQQRPWNVAPDARGDDMWDSGATIIDMTKFSCATILPGHRIGCWSPKENFRNFRLRPLDGHTWLKGFGEEQSLSYLNHARIIGAKNWRVPVTSMEDIREVWPAFPPDPPSADSDSELGENKTRQNDGETVEEALELKTEGPPPLRTDQPADTSRKRKREPEPDEQQRVWDTIAELLISPSSAKLGSRKKQGNFQPHLKRFMYEHPELFASEHPGAVPLLLTAFVYSSKAIKDLDLHQFRSLSGDQVVDLVRGVVDHNKIVYKRAAPDLKILDISFNPFVTLDHLAHIVELTALDELIVWKIRAYPERMSPRLQMAALPRS
ncbi:hypothetical protein FJTKL_08458 [Diaporthe vaccinii]|uniref:Uncharacterized protein n=1 Tax=Diaporthe vaccinii TaxID=105482 RepID=A0ABR4DPX0_9PEZI